jgi:hypothetical protein
VSAADEAREVDVVAREDVFDRHLWGGGYYCSCGHELNSPQGFSRHLLKELEPVLTAERHEARAEGARQALMLAANDDGWFDPANLQHHIEDFRDGVRAMQERLRDRADGVTGRSEA